MHFQTVGRSHLRRPGKCRHWQKRKCRRKRHPRRHRCLLSRRHSPVLLAWQWPRQAPTASLSIPSRPLFDAAALQSHWVSTSMHGNDGEDATIVAPLTLELSQPLPPLKPALAARRMPRCPTTKRERCKICSPQLERLAGMWKTEGVRGARGNTGLDCKPIALLGCLRCFSQPLRRGEGPSTLKARTQKCRQLCEVAMIEAVGAVRQGKWVHTRDSLVRHPTRRAAAA